MEAAMFNPIQVVIDAFVEQLQEQYEQVYGVLEPGYPGIIGFIGRLALENIANSDAPYHDMNHTIMVTLVGQEILRGKHVSEGGVTPREWLHFIISLLCHDIGYVRGVCRGDGNGRYVCDDKGGVVTLPDGSTDAWLTPYHVTRSKLFVRERFGKIALTHVDTLEVETNIEHTRFPVPEDEQHSSTGDYPGLLRAADLIGQLADVNYVRKRPRCLPSFARPESMRSSGIAMQRICARAIPVFSGRRLNLILKRLWIIYALPRKVSSGSPTFMPTCSQRNIAVPSELVEPARAPPAATSPPRRRAA
jgi:hypothetical protein